MRELQIILLSAQDAREVINGMDPVVASSNYGPTERAHWIDFAAKNLGPGGPVKVIKENERRNWFEANFNDGKLRLAPFFGKRLSNGDYSIHAKGKETDEIEPVQWALFDAGPGVAADETGVDMYGYALRCYRRTEFGLEPELHLILGSRPCQTNQRTAKIRPADSLVVRINEPLDIEPVYNVSFIPEGQP